MAVLVLSGRMSAQGEMRVSGSGDTKNVVGTQDDGRPYIRYGSERSSSRWITTPKNAQCAVDQGITWKGRSYYISLTGGLLVVEEGATKASASDYVSAFWNVMTIGTFQPKDGKPVEALALHSLARADYIEYRDLVKGTVIGSVAPPPPGTPLALAGSWRGAEGASDAPLNQRITDKDTWKAVHANLFAGAKDAPPLDLPVDFDRHVLVIKYAGRDSNCSGFSADCFENQDSVILQVRAHTYQSMGETPPRWPWGVFIVPLRPEKELVLERNRQPYIGGPTIWERHESYPALK
jgi:hypothetical protein